MLESGSRLALEEAVHALARGDFHPGGSEILNFGIGSDPAWIFFRVGNEGAAAAERNLLIDTSWLDRVEAYLVAPDGTVRELQFGDRQPFAERPADTRTFLLPHAFEPGVTAVYLRIETPDPMVLPLHLETAQATAARIAQNQYGYGLLYGFLTALLAYNLMLYAGLRQVRYALYAAYLGAFILLNIAYTGHGFRWLWPFSTTWTQWAQPVLMVLYAVAGLTFAIHFLGTSKHFPRTYTTINGSNAVAVGLLPLFMITGRQEEALVFAFTYLTLFTGAMVALGIASVRVGQFAARYFLAAAVFAMMGAASSSLAVWGLVPFSVWSYHAVELGMMIEAALLALALSHQFQVVQSERDLARMLARLDPLTRANNRRAFEDLTTPLWSSAVRYDRPLSLIMLDLDHFKRFNDVVGHDCGDEILKTVAAELREGIREQDVLARWGGEEFIILLPETGLEKAVALAERLRVRVARVRIPYDLAEVTVTISLGVAQRNRRHDRLHDLIASADMYLLKAKRDGRNRVVHGPFETDNGAATPSRRK